MVVVFAAGAVSCGRHEDMYNRQIISHLIIVHLWILPSPPISAVTVLILFSESETREFFFLGVLLLDIADYNCKQTHQHYRSHHYDKTSLVICLEV